MNKEVIFSIIYCLVTVGAFCAGKFIFPKIPASVKENLADLAEWAAITPGATVVINTGAAAVATDKVPDGALQKNPDGTVNAYDADGNKVGTVSAEAAEEAARNVGVIITEGNG